MSIEFIRDQYGRWGISLAGELPVLYGLLSLQSFCSKQMVLCLVKAGWSLVNLVIFPWKQAAGTKLNAGDDHTGIAP